MNKHHIVATIAAVLLTEGLEDTGCSKLNKFQAMALDLGGENFSAEDGVAYVEIKGPEAAQQFMDALDADDCIDGYDVLIDGDESSEEIDNLLAFPEETLFGFSFFLTEDEATYDGTEVDITEIAEAKRVKESEGEDVSKGFALLNKWYESKSPQDWGGKSLLVSRLAKELGIPQSASKRIFESWASQVDEKSEKLSNILGEKEVVPILADEEGVELDEIAKKITVNYRGVKKLKMKCPKGFKYSPAEHACVKIGGDELAKKRKASIKATRTRKAGGKALAARAAVRTKKAMNFRKAAGLS